MYLVLFSSSNANSDLVDFRITPDFAEQFRNGKFVGKESYPKFSALEYACSSYDKEDNCTALKTGYDQVNAAEDIIQLLPILEAEKIESLNVIYHGNWKQSNALPTYGFAFNSNQGYHPPFQQKEWNIALGKVKIIANIPIFYQFVPEKGSPYFGGYQEYIQKGYQITYTISMNEENERIIQITTRVVDSENLAYIEVSTYQEGIVAIAYADITAFIDEIEHLLALNQQSSKQFFHRNPR